MKLKHYILVCLQIILLQAFSGSTESCTKHEELSGIISFSASTSSNTRDLKKCWYINTPEDSYVILDLTAINLDDPYCQYIYLDVTEESGANYRICQYDYSARNWTKTIIGGVTVTVTVRDSWRRAVSFEMTYRTESIACAHKNNHRCSENKCIAPKQVCDGILDCDDGSDEDKCGFLDVTGASVSRRIAIDWLKRRQADFGWGKNTHRAMTALYLTGDVTFKGHKLEEEIMVKELELKMAAALLRNSTSPLSVNELSMYINALLITCHDHRNFLGSDLLKILAGRALFERSASPGAYLTLCNANWSFSAHEVRKLFDVLSKDSEYPFLFEIQAMTVMALSCIKQKTNFFRYLNNATDIYDETIENFMAHQNRDGSFGNAHTTAMVSQALIASGQMGSYRWSVKNATKFLMQNLNSSSVDFLSVYLTLPLFKGETLRDIGNVKCSGQKRRPGEDKNDISDLMDKLGGKVDVQYSLYIGDDKSIIHTIFLKVPENSTAYDVMRIAAVADHKYKFSHYESHDQIYVYEVAGITNDMEVGKFWLFFTDNPNRKGHLKQHTMSPNEIPIRSDEHLILWYKTTHI